MLDNPQHFVCHANGLQIGRRINPLTADEELELGNLYFLVPMPMLHSLLSETDMAALGLKANSAMKAKAKAKNRRSSRASARGRVLPFCGDLMRPEPETEMKTDALLLSEEEKQISGAQEEEELLELNLEKEEDPEELLELNLENEEDPQVLRALAQLRLNPSKRWKPKLETVEEFRPKLQDLLQWNVEVHENY